MPRATRTGPRPEVAACYDHLGGAVGQALLRCLLAAGWVRADWLEGGKTANERITPAGLDGLAGWGVEVGLLAGSGRKPVAVCAERHRGQVYDHAGAHLGALLRRWLERQGWVTAAGGALVLSEAGRRGLAALSCHLEEGA